MIYELYEESTSFIVAEQIWDALKRCAARQERFSLIRFVLHKNAFGASRQSPPPRSQTWLAVGRSDGAQASNVFVSISALWGKMPVVTLWALYFCRKTKICKLKFRKSARKFEVSN